MTYTPKFRSSETVRPFPRPDGVPYRYSAELELAVNVAMAARRPLLLTGLPGTGKSSLAGDVAWRMGWRYYPESITSRTTAQDLQWSYDTVRRLAQANAPSGDVDDQSRFVTPGPLWRAFDPGSPAKHGPPRAARTHAWHDDGKHAVVLLDEIDKAEPDVPNDLLWVVDRREFTVRETGQQVAAPADLQVLMVITSNGERDLAPAFVRRCVCHTIELAKDANARAVHLKEVAALHVPEVSSRLTDAVYALFSLLTAAAATRSQREPSTAELIDALRACRELGITDVGERWEEVAIAAIWKLPDPPGPAVEAVVAAATAAASDPSAPETVAGGEQPA